MERMNLVKLWKELPTVWNEDECDTLPTMASGFFLLGCCISVDVNTKSDLANNMSEIRVRKGYCFNSQYIKNSSY